jgi:hypothetical protein
MSKIHFPCASISTSIDQTKFKFFQPIKTLVILNDTGKSKNFWRSKLTTIINTKVDWLEDRPNYQRTVPEIIVLSPADSFEGAKLKRFLKFRPYTFSMTDLIQRYVPKKPTRAKKLKGKEKEEALKNESVMLYSTRYLGNSKKLIGTEHNLEKLDVKRTLFIKSKITKKQAHRWGKWEPIMENIRSYFFWGDVLHKSSKPNLVFVSEQNWKKISLLYPEAKLFNDFIDEKSNQLLIKEQLKKLLLVRSIGHDNRFTGLCFSVWRTFLSYNEQGQNTRKKLNKALRSFTDFTQPLILEKFLSTLDPEIRHAILKYLEFLRIENNEDISTRYRMGVKTTILPDSSSDDFKFITELLKEDELEIKNLPNLISDVGFDAAQRKISDIASIQSNLRNIFRREADRIESYKTRNIITEKKFEELAYQSIVLWLEQLKIELEMVM